MLPECKLLSCPIVTGMDSEDEIFLTQSRFSNHVSSGSEYDTDNFISDILGLENVRPENKVGSIYLPECSDIRESEEDELLVLTAENVEREIQSATEVEHTEKPSTSKNEKSRFPAPKSDEDMKKIQSKQFAPATMSKIRWAVNTFNEWQKSRNETAKKSSDISPILVDLDDMTKDELNYSISRFLCEVRKTDGSEYPSETMHGFVITIQLYLDTIGKNYKFLGDEAFSQIKNTLDNVMKTKSKQNVGGAVKQALPITEEEEEILWRKNVLGDDTPEKLVFTMLYLFGLNFALRGGQEHRDLRRGENSQISLCQNEQGKYLSYTEDTSKSNQGGLKHRQIKKKSVQAYANSDPNRCIVTLYEKYISKCPDPAKCSAFYLRPLAKPTGNLWYAAQPMGRHKLATVVSTLCNQGGLEGYRTNHSLRTSAATRLYHAGVDEQLITEVTGHRSNAVRNYKRTTTAQKRKISDVIQGTSETKQQKKNIQVSININLNK